ncbi:MAG TPA: PilZ domain-containing protein [Vicinamibacteria bacterium]|jgi:DNA-binding response OmpR family regulator
MTLTAVIVAPEPLDDELAETVLFRQNVERYEAASLEQARHIASGGRPDIVIVDQRMANAAALVAQLRQDPLTRGVSIVAIARGDFEPAEVALLEAGANAILRLPPGADWDDRLERLIHVPLRRAARFGVHVQIDSRFEVAGRIFPVTALNLSVNGMLVESAQGLRVGDDVQFAFRLPQSEEVVAGMGTVVREAGPAGQFGVELTHVQGDGRVRIKVFVESEP